MKTNPPNDPLYESRKKAFADGLMNAIKASRRVRGLPEDLKDWTPEQLAVREQSRLIVDQRLDDIREQAAIEFNSLTQAGKKSCQELTEVIFPHLFKPRIDAVKEGKVKEV